MLRFAKSYHLYRHVGSSGLRPRPPRGSVILFGQDVEVTTLSANPPTGSCLPSARYLGANAALFTRLRSHGVTNGCVRQAIGLRLMPN